MAPHTIRRATLWRVILFFLLSSFHFLEICLNFAFAWRRLQSNQPISWPASISAAHAINRYSRGASALSLSLLLFLSILLDNSFALRLLVRKQFFCLTLCLRSFFSHCTRCCCSSNCCCCCCRRRRRRQHPRQIRSAAYPTPTLLRNAPPASVFAHSLTRSFTHSLTLSLGISHSFFTVLSVYLQWVLHNSRICFVRRCVRDAFLLACAMKWKGILICIIVCVCVFIYLVDRDHIIKLEYSTGYSGFLLIGWR